MLSAEAVIIYIGIVRPWDAQIFNDLEIVNECFIMLLLYHMILFTNFYTNYEVRATYVGNSFTVIVIANIAVNLMLVLVRQWTTIQRSCIKW